MNEVNTTPIQQTTGSFKMLRAMVGIGVACALLIVVTYEGTSSRIKNLRTEALQAAIFKVLPGTSDTRAYTLEQGEFTATTVQSGAERLVYAGFNEEGDLVGIAIEAEGQGYAGIIRILYGYDPNSEKVIGFHVLESLETPGLGDKIEKDPTFLDNFKALDIGLNSDKSVVKNLVVTVKRGEKKNEWEIDGITGATISSRAIGSIIGKSTAELAPLIFKNKEGFKQ